VSTGLAVDSVVLASAPGGGPGADTLTVGPRTVPAGPSTSVEQPGRLTWRYSVTGAGSPYWIVLGQSVSDGFVATAADGVDLGPPTLVNGYAAGWLVDPTVVGADTTVVVSWTPQTAVWIGLALSAVGALVCLALVFLPRRRAVPSDDRPSLRPELVRPWEPTGPTLAPRATLALTLGGGLLAGLAAGPAVGLALAVLLAAAGALPRGQLLLRAAVVLPWAAAAGFVVAKQVRNGYVLDFNWMNQFELTHAWTLIVVVALVADPVVSALRGRRDGQSSG